MSYPEDVYVELPGFPPLVVQWDGEAQWSCRAEDETLRPRGHGETPEAAVEDYQRVYDQRIALLKSIIDQHKLQEGYEAIKDEHFNLAWWHMKRANVASRSIFFLPERGQP